MDEQTKPGDSGRRSRRGYRYQDVHALDRCLDLIDGVLDSVEVEGEEDVTCVRRGSSPCQRYEQVKTIEDPSQLWSIAKLTVGEKGEGGKRRPDRSILGKLFIGKRLHDEVEFMLVLNEEVNDDLRVLTKRPEARDATSLAKCTDEIARRLDGLPLPEGFTLQWCAKHLIVDVRSRTIEDLEANVLKRLGNSVETECKIRPLAGEVETVLSLVMDEIALEARHKIAKAFDQGSVRALLQMAFAKVDRPADFLPPGADSSRLRSKLAPLDFDTAMVEKQVSMHLQHRTAFRRADAAQRRAVSDLVDEVFTACSVVTARRTSGELTGGRETYEATIDALREMHVSGKYAARGYSLADLQRAMLDIASRCQHRFVQ